MQILVFKTNLTDASHITNVEPLLNVHPGILNWNVDLKDCDNILRIEATDLKGREIETILDSAGYYCEEL
ncbi:MAG TPA: hypothetical protein VK498_02040 [Ferruginibacter sp.]|nr:hypothetical protein [Ferruginibacter sp.]